MSNGGRGVGGRGVGGSLGDVLFGESAVFDGNHATLHCAAQNEPFTRDQEEPGEERCPDEEFGR